MKEKIFYALKQSYSSLGLGDSVLMALAATLDATDIVTDENLADNYLVSLQKHGIEKDAQMRCHYVSLKILFETLNVIN